MSTSSSSPETCDCAPCAVAVATGFNRKNVKVYPHPHSLVVARNVPNVQAALASLGEQTKRPLPPGKEIGLMITGQCNVDETAGFIITVEPLKGPEFTIYSASDTEGKACDYLSNLTDELQRRSTEGIDATTLRIDKDPPHERK